MRRGPRAVLVTAGVALPLGVLLAVLAARDSETGSCRAERLATARADGVAAGPDPVAWTLYSEPVDRTRLLHNLAHGGIAVRYGDRIAPSARNRLEAWYRADPVALVVAPLPELDDSLRVSAWAAAERCAGFEAQELDAFRDKHRFRGPERIPPAQLRPLPAVRVEPQRVRGRATISFAIPPPGSLTVVIRDSSARTMRRLGSFSGRTGQKLTLGWDGRDGRGRGLPPGRYVVALLRPGRPTISASFRVAD